MVGQDGQPKPELVGHFECCLAIQHVLLQSIFKKPLHEATRVVDRWLGAVSMAVVSTHLELHQLGGHKHLRATASYTAVVCLRDRLRVYSAISCYMKSCCVHYCSMHMSGHNDRPLAEMSGQS